ncbi:MULTISPECIES: hypothetical protein [Lysobacter]|uniref:hypothetical protein n=1 Tax=Lysobacter TaxID=68 RepID=UPI00126A6CC7|nr:MULTISPECIES: hypothetical protein [Lysobacter]
MIDPKTLLASIPEALRGPLIDEYRNICKAFNEGRWKLAALDAGRFCEVAYTIIHGAIVGNFAASPSKPNNFVAACRALESLSPIAVGDRSLRVLIPRLLPALYEIRNNRNVGHVGGDVVPNKMDATLVREGASWVVAELIRITHGVTTSEAQDAVDALIERSHPLVWEIDGTKRVLAPDMKMADKVLMLLYTTPGWVTRTNLKKWTRDNINLSRVLNGLFDKQYIELDSSRATITPLGVAHIEGTLLKPK